MGQKRSRKSKNLNTRKKQQYVDEQIQGLRKGGKEMDLR